MAGDLSGRISPEAARPIIVGQNSRYQGYNGTQSSSP